MRLLIAVLLATALSGCMTVNKSIHINDSCHINVRSTNVSTTDADAQDLLDLTLPLIK